MNLFIIMCFFQIVLNNSFQWQRPFQRPRPRPSIINTKYITSHKCNDCNDCNVYGTEFDLDISADEKDERCHNEYSHNESCHNESSYIEYNLNNTKNNIDEMTIILNKNIQMYNFLQRLLSKYNNLDRADIEDKLDLYKLPLYYQNEYDFDYLFKNLKL